MLPDGITHMKGFVKDPNEAKRYLALDEEKAPSSPEGGHDYVDDSSDNPQQRKNIDLTKTVYIPLSMKFKTYPFFFICKLQLTLYVGILLDE